MLSYQHGYHAGNFADVVKHISLTHLLSCLTLKEKPLFYLDTHSGKGIYDLLDKQAAKTKESEQGIKLLWEKRHSLPIEFDEYLKLINEYNPTGSLRYYPGSPLIAINKLRTQDRMYFCELHPKEYAILRKQPRLNKRVHFSNTNGTEALKALLPPPEKRGLIFIDPSFEIKQEYKEIPLALKKTYSHFINGVFCVWYPIINKALTDKIKRGLNEINAKNWMHIQFFLNSELTEGMSGCGLWVINPPYTFSEKMKIVLNTLKKYFNPGISFYIMEASL